MKLTAIIPARLNSKRLPGKVLKKINDVPMIEHVRRKAISSKMFKDVIILTNDKKIKRVINQYKGKVILNKKRHLSGTSRATEIINRIKTDIYVIIFADELLLKTSQIKNYCKIIKNDKKSDCWNATSPLDKKDLDSNNVVKCIVNKEKLIVDFSRKKVKKKQNINIVKSVGIISFRRNVLKKYKNLKKTFNEKKTNIEQFRIIDNNFYLRSVNLHKVENSINSIDDFKLAYNLLKIENKKNMKI